MEMRLWAMIVAIVTVLSTLQICCAGASDTRPMATGGSSLANELILCGGDEVYILALSQQGNGSPKKVWSWRAQDRPELPSYLRGWAFGGTDECKPANGGRSILITSSGSGVALVDRATGKAVFWAVAENAHSADMLPGDRIAVATSGHEIEAPPKNPNRLIIYDARTPEKELYSTDLPWGHGVVWDPHRQILWALSDHDLRAYRLADWDSDHPSLDHLFSADLPEGGGHDLYPMPDSPSLIVTTNRHCWLFDRDKRSFNLHPQLAEAQATKSISVNPISGQVAYVQAEGGNWWGDHVRFLAPESELHRPGERVYKARWNLEVR